MKWEGAAGGGWMIMGDGEVGRTEEGCVGCMVGELLLAVVMELL